jgi:hypothetical protein
MIGEKRRIRHLLEFDIKMSTFKFLFLTFTFVVKILQVTRGCWWRWFTIDVLLRPSISAHRHLIDDYVPCMRGVKQYFLINIYSVVKTMYSWLIIRCVVEHIVVSVLWSCQVWDIVQQQLGAGSTVQWFLDRRSIYMSLILYGYVYMSGSE